ncbi:Bug family tripartite tricarboxylate transporter substrate binding protein [uncultured Jatrophihabitans sp.]|uniref:Bug family tripartite tricarboxylate transporter substrate binding protein n=1 Tax=uncultured Jatrophihabitans sp. TaxID=1610747 RepID=UPI0035C9F481
MSTAAACKSSGPGDSAGGSNDAAFYKGKTLRVIVPYGPGGGYDQWPRVMQPYLKKYLGVSNIDIVNAPGGGGLIGTGQIYNASPDGLTIGDTNAGGDVFDQMDNATGFNMDVTKYQWIGRPDDDPHVLATRTGSGVDFTKLLKTKSTVKALATGKGSSDYNAAVVVYNSFKIPFSMIAAFSGSSDEKASFLSGEGTTASLSSSDIAAVKGKAEAILVVSAKKFSKLPNVPTVVDVAKAQNLPTKTVSALQALSDVMDLGHAWFAPKGVPAGRITALQSAFQKAMADPKMLAAAKKAGLYPGYESGTQLSSAVNKALAQKSLFTELLKST